MLRTYDNSVFINCPFDSTYRPLFEAVTFAAYDCGYFPRSAMEVEDSSQVRIQKIEQIIRESRLRRYLSAVCRELHLDPANLTFRDLTAIIVSWMETHPLSQS